MLEFIFHFINILELFFYLLSLWCFLTGSRRVNEKAVKCIRRVDGQNKAHQVRIFILKIE